MPSDVNESNIVDENYFSREKALQVDLLILQQVEALEERIASASIQAKVGQILTLFCSFRTSSRLHSSKRSPPINSLNSLKIGKTVGFSLVFL